MSTKNLSFDGKGINDAAEEYCPRVAAFSNDAAAKRLGHLFAAAPDLLAELKKLVERCDGDEGIQIDGSNMDTRSAHIAILRAEGSDDAPMLDFEIVNHGVEHEQYFQGCGVAMTKFNHCVTGCGDNIHEAFDDACEQIASMGYDVPADLVAEKALEPDHGDTSGNDAECHYYLSIRFR